jgi:hypothetical protein
MGWGFKESSLVIIQSINNFWPTQPLIRKGEKLQYQFLEQQISKAATKLSKFAIIRAKRKRK